MGHTCIKSQWKFEWLPNIVEWKMMKIRIKSDKVENIHLKEKIVKTKVGLRLVVEERGNINNQYQEWENH